MKNLQEKLTRYLEETPLEKITIESILATFKKVDVKDDDTDLYLSHALVNQKYKIDEAFKMLEVLFQNGLDPNKEAEFSGYTFLHIALYGAEVIDDTEVKEEKINSHQTSFTHSVKIIPYPLSFFKKMIPLAKKYGFDVNSKDLDGDTLIHTAIYSEGYFDKIEPLIRLLGKDFDITAKNNDKKTIIDALNDSIKEAKTTKNTKWSTQLKEEKELLSSIIKASSNPLFSIPEYISGTVDISSYLDPAYIKKEIEAKINTLLSDFNQNELEKLTLESTSNTCKSLKESIKSSALTEEEKTELLSNIEKQESQIIEKLKSKIEENTNKLNLDSSVEECENLQNIIQKSYLPIEIIEEFVNRITSLISKINQQLFLKQLKLDIENIHTIKDIENCLTKANEIIDPSIKQEIIEGLNKRHQEVKSRLNQINAKSLVTKNLLVLDGTYFGNNEYKNEERESFKNLNLNLKEIKEEKLDSFVDIQSFDEFEESLDALSEEITLNIKSIMKNHIYSELEKAKIVDQTIGTNFLNELINEIGEWRKENQPPKGTVPKQKKKKA